MGRSGAPPRAPTLALVELNDRLLHHRPGPLTGCHTAGPSANDEACLRPTQRRGVAAHARSTVEPQTTRMAGTCPGHVRAHNSDSHGGGMNFGIPVDMSIVHSVLCT